MLGTVNLLRQIFGSLEINPVLSKRLSIKWVIVRKDKVTAPHRLE